MILHSISKLIHEERVFFRESELTKLRSSAAVGKAGPVGSTYGYHYNARIAAKDN
jgi:hypothetical protein